MEVPNLDWSVCYKGIDAKQVRFILGKAPGWETGFTLVIGYDIKVVPLCLFF
jgi:hypothetical protein